MLGEWFGLLALGALRSPFAPPEALIPIVWALAFRAAAARHRREVAWIVAAWLAIMIAILALAAGRRRRPRRPGRRVHRRPVAGPRRPPQRVTYRTCPFGHVRSGIVFQTCLYRHDLKFMRSRRPARSAG
ncbi:hypothetical protein [Nannocystis pusilla]|uniref:hypothetical protein n=1 Tax=Nannocystis pusilla TaxID=889268 RepID=UPI003B7B9831